MLTRGQIHQRPNAKRASREPIPQQRARRSTKGIRIHRSTKERMSTNGRIARQGSRDRQSSSIE